MKRFALLFVIAGCALFVISISASGISQMKNSDEMQAPPDSLVYKRTPQGELKLFFHYPERWSADGANPAIVFFFGGGWSGGSTDHFKPQAEYFAGRGMVTVRADYRVLRRHGTSPDKCVEDGKSAIRWVRNHAKELGIDPNRIIASGGSSGGHVAACTWTVNGLEAEGEDLNLSSKPDLLVLFNPVMNTTVDRISERMGSDEMAQLISPNAHLVSETPPMIMFFGTEDKLIEGAYGTLQIADELGFHAELWTAKNEKHGFFNRSPWMEWTLYLADRFLNQNGYIKGNPSITLSNSVEMTLVQTFEPAELEYIE